VLNGEIARKCCEIFKGVKPVLAGVDAASTYCYLLAAADHRDGSKPFANSSDSSIRTD
jgi:hypothetical protein